jgi:hypothetical protein
MKNFKQHFTEAHIGQQLGPEPDRGEILAQAAARLGEDEGLVFFDEGAVVQRKSGISGKLNKIFIKGLTRDQYDSWRDGELIQRAMPTLSPDQREFLKTGITPEEWEATFGGK